jgi:tetratricopeptide (TPR) repeat protein
VSQNAGTSSHNQYVQPIAATRLWLTLLLCLKGIEMDIIEEFKSLFEAKKYDEALPLIEEILKRNETFSTSWFNYGACLSNINKPKEAAEAYLKAYRLDPDSGGALYRACLSLADAEDSDKLYEVFQEECKRDSEMIENFLEEKAFADFFKEERYQDLVKKYSRKKSRWKFW